MNIEKVSERRYNEMLEVLPPAYLATHGPLQGFQVGEATSHDEGMPTYASFIKDTSEDPVCFYELPPMTSKVFQEFITSARAGEELENATISDAMELEDRLVSEYSREAVDAYLSLGIEQNDGLEDFEEAYNGEYDSDEAFAQEQAEQLGLLDKGLSWPYTCIDWEYASRELMYDYSEVEGHYFRNL